MGKDDSKMKVDISSTVLEKGVDAAKSFLSKLISPAIEETGLLIKDHITYWRFKNQVKTVNKAHEYCIKHSVSPKEISLKLLCPLLDYAGLEEDSDLQDKWAILLANMVDSEQNIQNHVFPYILSQISKTEFDIVEISVAEKFDRDKRAQAELDEFKKEYTQKLHDIKQMIAALPKGQEHFSGRINLESELRTIYQKEKRINDKLFYPIPIFHTKIKEFEIYNLVRLGIVKEVVEHYAYADPVKLPDKDDYQYKRSINIEVEIEQAGEHYVLTELGEMFIKACTEKRSTKKN